MAACIGVLTVMAAQGDVGAWEATRQDGAEVVEAGHDPLFVEPDPDTLHVRHPEPVGEVDLNEDLSSGMLIEGFGTGDDDVATVHITGRLSIDPTTKPRGEEFGPVRAVVDGTAAEDDGSIERANPDEHEIRWTRARWEGALGDNPDAETVGDVDFFALGAVRRGAHIVVETDTRHSPNPIDTMVAVYDESGELIAANDDQSGVGPDSLLRVEAHHDGEYFVAVTACCQLPDDPYDPTSAGIPGAHGAYTVEMGTEHIRGSVPSLGQDADVFLVELRAGDVLAGAFTDAVGRIAVHDPVMGLPFWSSWNGSDLYPRSSPLRHDGDIGIEYVASADGVHAIEVSNGIGGYEGELRVVRSPAEQADAGRQIVFLDTDGADVEPSVLDPSAPSAALGPLSGYLARWGLDPADEAAVVDAMAERFGVILARLSEDGTSPIDLRRSDRDADPWGEPNVSRVVVGGSDAPTTKVATGTAESVDPGNMDREETAVVLLDLLSAPDGARSINSVRLAPDASKAELVGAALGTVAAHETSHLLGAWNTDPFGFNDRSIMNSGGDLATFIGVGDDGVWGTGDDVVPSFDFSEFGPDVGYTSIQQPWHRLQAGLGLLAPEGR
ncbi:MAG: hypothetical protein S0880_09120 [Actinomycetota bacterium]|nr:hypothetical protein [Actinomycetota bacterium]